MSGPGSDPYKLAKALSTARVYAQENPELQIIMFLGDGDGDGITEGRGGTADRDAAGAAAAAAAKAAAAGASAGGAGHSVATGADADAGTPSGIAKHLRTINPRHAVSQTSTEVVYVKFYVNFLRSSSPRPSPVTLHPSPFTLTRCHYSQFVDPNVFKQTTLDVRIIPVTKPTDNDPTDTNVRSDTDTDPMMWLVAEAIRRSPFDETLWLDLDRTRSVARAVR